MLDKNFKLTSLKFENTAFISIFLMLQRDFFVQKDTLIILVSLDFKHSMTFTTSLKNCSKCGTGKKFEIRKK